MLEFGRGDLLPVPCRHCGNFLKFRVDEGSFARRCDSCGKTTIITCRRREGEWTITTAPDGALTRKPC